MMKRNAGILLMTALLLVFSCAKENQGPSVPGVPGVPEGDIPVRIGYSYDGQGLPTKVSVVGGEESGNWVKDLWMLCFTKEGIYLGYREARFYDADDNFIDEGTFPDGCHGRELFYGSVPARTARIHFIANTEYNTPSGQINTRIPGSDQIGASENLLMQSAALSLTTADRTICYWGFVGKPNAEAMADWLAQKETDEFGEVTYTKKEGSVVHLIRDRARVTFGSMLDFYRLGEGDYEVNGESVSLDSNPIDYKILSIDWILTNGLTKGYIAPYNLHNSTDHFAGYYDPSASPMLDEGRLTPFDAFAAGEQQRYTAVESIGGQDQMLRVWEDDGTDLGHVTDNPLFLFEDANDPADPPKIVLRVKYMKNRNGSSTAASNLVTKYHTLMLLKEDGTPSRILRNHGLVLNINGLPYEGLGYSNFEDAAGCVDYVNNRTVTIDDTVSDVTDGDYKLQIPGSTFLLFTDPALAGTTHTFDFIFQAADGGNGDVSEYDTDSFEAGWTTNVLPSFAAPDVTVSSYNPTTGRGTVSFTFGTTINNELQTGQIMLRAKATNLSRRVSVYTITKFNNIPSGYAALELERDGTRTVTVSGTACDVYKMVFNLPGSYPIGLFPINVRMASTTLTPIGCRIGSGEEDDSVVVVMESTENGSTLDGITLSGFNYTTTPRPWNYREQGKPWDFWYSYTIQGKPMRPDGEGNLVPVLTDTQCTMYFADTRPLRAAANRNTSVGLYLFIKNFGDVIPVTTP